MKLLKEAREAMEMTQGELADATSLSQSQVSHLELGRRYPRPETRKRIEAVLGTKVDWLTCRLQGPVRLVGYAENESPEDSMLQALLAYWKSAQGSEVKERIRFVEDITERFKKEEMLKGPR